VSDKKFSTQARITNDISGLNITLSSSSPYISVLNSRLSIGSLRNGSDTSGLSDSLSVKIASKVPDDRKIPLVFSVSDNSGNSWQAEAEITVRKINNSFFILNLNVRDFYGNGDNIANKGEKIEL